MSRTQITIDPELQQRAHAKATTLGITFAEYVRRLLARDLGESPARKESISLVFDLVREGQRTDVARHKDEMLGKAVWDEHVAKTGQSRTRARVKLSRR